MKAAGIFTILFILYVSLNKKNRKDKMILLLMLLVYFELYANAGLFSRIGGVEIQYGDLLWGVLFLFSVEFLARNRIGRKCFLYFLIFLFFLAVNNINAMIFYEENDFIHNALISARFVVSIVVFIYIMGINGKNEITVIYSVILKMQFFTYIVIAFEFVIKNVFLSDLTFKILNFLFGVSINQVTWMIDRGGLYALQGFCKEPSHLSIMLLFTAIFDIEMLIDKRPVKKYIFVNVFLLVISGSFSAVLFLFVCALYYFAALDKIKTKFLFIMAGTVFIVCLCIMFSKSELFIYYSDRMQSALEILSGSADTNTLMYTSNGVRLGGIANSLNLFAKYPLLGAGIGNVNSGAIPALLGAGGMTGIVSWYAVMLNGINIRYVWKKILVLSLAMFFTMDVGVFYSSYFILFLMVCGSGKERRGRQFRRPIEKNM